MNRIYSKQNAIYRINELGAQRVPFLFIANFDLDQIHVYPIDEIPDHIKFQTSTKKDATIPYLETDASLSHTPPNFAAYQKAFDSAIAEIKYGNSYLLNLSCKSEIDIDLDLAEIYRFASAPYKLLYKDRFVVFSPECFVQILEGTISTFPMKGTIRADIPGAYELLLNNEKEKAEHATITDLLRNDLSMVAKNIRVEKYRYIEKIHTNGADLYQASSKICGDLPDDYHDNLGSIMMKLLPAGSVTGAPKAKTVEIIKDIESYDRDFYTGVFGVYDGTNLDSAVMIRFIQKEGNKLYFKSGGGITSESDLNSEYNEILDKIYVPFYRNDKNTSGKSGKSEISQLQV